MSKIGKQLVEWFRANKRPLPWRQTKHWYPVFLSEFLLQQTQVIQALPYYKNFIKRFPTVFDLAKAQEDELLQMWSGLGYYSRARHLLKAAQVIVQQFNGTFPQNRQQALQLPGIGPYTAAAILSIAFNQPLVVVDGNVLRVIARFFALKQDIRKAATKKAIEQHALQLMPAKQAAEFNEALMELGALICKPKAPLCFKCPLQKQCKAYKNKLTNELPFKSPPAPKQKKFHLVLVVQQNDRLLLGQRPTKGLLAGMWEFPVVEVNTLPLPSNTIEQAVKQVLTVSTSPDFYPLPILKHSYSHIALQFQPLLFRDVKIDLLNSEQYVTLRWFNALELKRLALHNAHKKILKHADFTRWQKNQ